MRMPDDPGVDTTRLVPAQASGLPVRCILFGLIGGAVAGLLIGWVA